MQQSISSESPQAPAFSHPLYVRILKRPCFKVTDTAFKFLFLYIYGKLAVHIKQAQNAGGCFPQRWHVPEGHKVPTAIRGWRRQRQVSKVPATRRSFTPHAIHCKLAALAVDESRTAASSDTDNPILSDFPKLAKNPHNRGRRTPSCLPPPAFSR